MKASSSLIAGVLCAIEDIERREHEVVLLIHEEIARNFKNSFSISERIAAVMIKLNRSQRLKIIQAYAPISSYDDEAVDSFYEDINQQ